MPLGLWRRSPRVSQSASLVDQLVRGEDAFDEVATDLFFTEDPAPTSVDSSFTMEGFGSATFRSQSLVGPGGTILPTEWFRRDDVKRVILVEVDYKDQSGTGDAAVPVTRTLYLSDGVYFDDENSRAYRACVKSAARYNRAIDRRTLQGRFTSSVGDVEIDNEDGEFDFLLTPALDGSEVRFYIGDPGDPITGRRAWLRSEFIFVFSAIAVKAVAPSFKRITLKLRDTSLLLDKKIGGNVLIGGTDVNANKYRPKQFGYVRNVTLVLVDGATLTYCYNETGDDTTLMAVRCRGDTIAYSDNGDGTCRLLANPAGGLVTGDVLVLNPDGATTSYPGFIDPMLPHRVADAFYQFVGVEAGLIAGGKYAGPSGNFAGAANGNFLVGVSIPEARDLSDVLEELCFSTNLYFAPLRDGQFTFGAFRPEAIEAIVTSSYTSVATVTVDSIIKPSEFRIDHADPGPYLVQGYANVNWTPQTDLATGLDPAVAELYRRKGFYSTADNGGTQDGLDNLQRYAGNTATHPYATWIWGNPELYHQTMGRLVDQRTLISPLSDHDAANFLFTWQSIHRTQRLPWLEFIDVPVDLSFYQVEIGNIVTLDLTHPDGTVRFGIDGLMYQCVSIDIALTDGVIRLGLVRRRPAIVD